VSAADVRTTRLTAAAALGVALLYLISVPVGSLGSLPASDASGAEVLRFFSEHRGGLLVALVLNGVAWCALMPAAFAGLRAVLGERGGRGGTAATVALICAGVEAALIGVALTFGALAAYAAPSLGGELAKVLGDGLGVATNASAWPTVPCVLALAICARRSGALGSAVPVVAVAVAVLHAVAAISFARSGALSPSGIALAAPPAFAILMGCVGVTLLRRAARATRLSSNASVELSASAGH
jgi:stage V sporulation protein SpoVS